MVLSIIFLEDKHNMLLHLSKLYEYQLFFQHRICFSKQSPDYQWQVTWLHMLLTVTRDPLTRSTSLFLICCLITYSYSTIPNSTRAPRGRDRMVVGFTTTCAISAYDIPGLGSIFPFHKNVDATAPSKWLNERWVWFRLEWLECRCRSL